MVGLGRRGGTVAARLAEAGYSVLVLEAGGDPRSPDAATYDVPAFHPFATENPAMRWDFFVRHYGDTARQARDPKFVREQDGVWYPRAGTLGGCTAHNAMILVYPSNSDWDQLADLTGDPSWRSPAMWKYFQRIENCRHRPFERFWHSVVIHPAAMNDAALVRVGECVGDFGSDAHGVRNRELVFPLEAAAQRLALDERHHVEEQPVGVPRVEQGEDVRVLQRRGEFDLLQEPVGAEHCRELGVQHLDRDLPVVLDVLGEIHRRHPALAELTLDPVAIGQRRGQAR